MATAYTTVSSKGQMVIPAEIRAQLGIEPGTRVAVHVEGSRVILEPATRAAKLQLIEQLRGCTAGGPSGSDMLIEERRRERARELAADGW
ncbi:MAG TPA: AbrB/MazE/SpoVT family DNA-binding domain-containing protein [Terracidiphilus sp.]|jgi:AbrB family looped-hinge helix DNA binding protein